MRFDDKIASTNYTIAKEIAKYNFVYYIDNPFTIKDCIYKWGTPSFRKRFNKIPRTTFNVLQTEQPNLKVVITPPVLSINWLPEGKLYRKLLSFNEAIITHTIKKLIKKFRIRNYVFINSFNFYYPDVSGSLNARLNIYQCVDPIIFPFEQKHGLISEKRLIANADLIICTSQALCNEKRKANANTYFIPNAADVEHSNKALSKTLKTHSILMNIKKPIIGYLGNIERRIDYNLLANVIKMNPDKSFVLVGPTAPEFIPDWLNKLANVHLPGPVTYDEIPEIMKGFDVSMIPFKKDDVSRNIFPLKLFEYLGAGTPVVATDFNLDLAAHTGETVAYCTNAEAFSNAIKDALMNDDEHIKKSRLKIAQENTWTKRGEEFAQLIYIHLNSESTTPAKQAMAL
jgi:glycosyltransferase involved in cell wall biosynthesis